MAMTKITIRAGQKPTKEQIGEIRRAARAPIRYTSDAPASGPEALAEFAAKARELRRTQRKIKPAVTIRLSPDCLETYKGLGKGYTGIMADVLEYVACNPVILKRARR